MCGENKSCGCAKTETAAPVVEEAVTPEVITASADTLVAGAVDPATDLPSEWHAVLTVEGLRTTDHRMIGLDSVIWRQLPLAIFAQFNNAGHPDAAIVGQILTVSREPWLAGTNLIMATGNFNLAIEEGRKAAQMCKDQTLRWGSVDLEPLETRYVEVSTEGQGGGDIMDILFGEEDMSTPDDWYEEVLSGRIMGWTMVSMPAFPQAVIAPIDVPLDIPEPMGVASQVTEGLLASAANIPVTPLASWFANPELVDEGPFTVENNGRIFGRLALWDTCHTGFADTCVVPPRSEQDYAYFKTGRVVCDNGEQIRVGQITFDTGHAGSTLGWQDTTSHYDHTGTAVADVTVGEDDLGIWFAGALRPGLTDEQIRAVRASALSGDWRRIGGGLELVAALCVNVPGFPIVASLAPSLTAAGKRGDEQVSLITAGVKPRNAMVEMARQIQEIRAMIKPLMPVAVERLALRVNGPKVEPKPLATIGELRQRVNAS